mmetsp:Transcript_39230/g.116224  ORF Transcript_39230/g.116224 Transcript_39230/m.116224 type:complete len:360 (-) Transcript_39230:89-1168(-)
MSNLKISALDIANLRMVFGKLDIDGDGTLTLQEMIAGADQLGIDAKDITTLFRQIDVDNSGEIDYTELADHYAEFGAQKLRAIFTKLDVDGSGSLTLDEMKAGVDDLGISEAELETLFRKMDTDGSGEIDYSEFANNMLNEMSGGFASATKAELEGQRFAGMGHKALNILLVSMEGLPYREEHTRCEVHEKVETFCVRLRWPSAPFFGECELHGLVAYDWGTTDCPPDNTHGAYVFVDKVMRLPWVAGQPYAMIDIFEQDLMKERFVGSVRLTRERLHEKGTKRYAIHGLDHTLEGHAHVKVTIPDLAHQRANDLADGPENYRKLQLMAMKRSSAKKSHKKKGPWWDLCSDMELCPTDH